MKALLKQLAEPMQQLVVWLASPTQTQQQSTNQSTKATLQQTATPAMHTVVESWDTLTQTRQQSQTVTQLATSVRKAAGFFRLLVAFVGYQWPQQQKQQH